jgi:hypothetical protein
MVTSDQKDLESGECPDVPRSEVAVAAAAGTRKDDRSMGTTRGRRWHRSEPTELDFPPVRNGIDYLISVIEHLDEAETTPGPRNLKYAVLRLQAAVEVLLKARLLHEHWSLVFRDPGHATREKYESGDFESCGTDAAVARLRNIAGVRFAEKETKALKALAEDRNALQHYGLTHSAAAVEARAGRVLDFLMSFLDEHLLPQLRDPERATAIREMAPVRVGVGNISSYVKGRLNRIRGELTGHESLTLRCPLCGQMALVIVAGGGLCHFCRESWSADEMLAVDYLEARGESEELLQPCPQCDEYALVEGVIFADDPTVPGTLFCFDCTSRYAPDELSRCAGCRSASVPFMMLWLPLSST